MPVVRSAQGGLKYISISLFIIADWIVWDGVPRIGEAINKGRDENRSGDWGQMLVSLIVENVQNNK